MVPLEDHLWRAKKEFFLHKEDNTKLKVEGPLKSLGKFYWPASQRTNITWYSVEFGLVDPAGQ